MATKWVIILIAAIALASVGVLFTATFWSDKSDDTSDNNDYKEYKEK